MNFCLLCNPAHPCIDLLDTFYRLFFLYFPEQIVLSDLFASNPLVFGEKVNSIISSVLEHGKRGNITLDITLFSSQHRRYIKYSDTFTFSV